MIVLLRDRSGREHRLGVSHGSYVDADEASGPVHDLRHLVALIGLADCHAHLSGNDVEDMTQYDGSGLADRMFANARRQMEGGVLLLAEKGSKSSLTLQFLDVAEQRRPRMQMAGRMIAVNGGYYPGFAAEIDESDLVPAIDEAAQGGATWVKLVGDWPRKGRGVVPNFSEEALRQIVTSAHAAGCRVAVHTAGPDTPQMAVRAGVDSIEHGLFLSRQDLIALGERGGAWVPTIFAMEAIAAWLGAASSGGRVLAAGLENAAAVLAFAAEVGVAVLAGTDLALPHGRVAAEALRLAEYGLSPAQTVDAVGDAAYRYLGEPAGFSPGLPADAVLFAGDPASDLQLLTQPVAVMRAGVAIVGELETVGR